MKILLFTDLHMCSRASIVNKWGETYPARLENCIKSVNWLEHFAEEQKCDYIVNLGDFFDKPDLNSETITACNDIKWSDIEHYSLVGNHDASSSSLMFNSVNCLQKVGHKIISEPMVMSLPDCDLCFLPYVVECDRKPIKEYFPKIDLSKKPVVIFSHNDLQGIQLGPVVSRTGFTVEEIEQTCNLFINGHLHNGQAISSKIFNLGNLTGKDFGEDASRYNHNIAILDTETLNLTFIENPYAYNFYKIQIDTEADLKLLDNLKAQAVVSIKCDSSCAEMARKYIAEQKSTILESRIIVVKKYEDTASDEAGLDLSVDHLARFVECCKANIEYTALLDEEISQICK